MPQKQKQRRPGLLYPIKPESGLIGAQPAVHKVLIFNTRPFKAGCLRFGVATLCRFSQPWVTLGDLGWKWVDIGGRGGGGRAKRA